MSEYRFLLIFFEYHWVILIFIDYEICSLFSKKCVIWINKPFTELYLLCFMLLHIECLKFVAFPQLFTSLLLILKRLVASKQEHVINWYQAGTFYFLQSPGQRGTRLLSKSICWLVNLKKERIVFYLRLIIVMETGSNMSKNNINDTFRLIFLKLTQ